MATSHFLSPSTALLPPSLPLSTSHRNSNPIPHSISHSFFFLLPKKFLNPRPPPSEKPFKSFSVRSHPIASNNAGVDNRKTGPNSGSEEHVKVPTAPWMRGPFHLPRSEVLDLSAQRKKKKTGLNDVDEEDSGRALTGKVSGARGRKAMKKIYEGIGKLRRSVQSEENPEEIEIGFSFRELGKLGRLRTFQSVGTEESLGKGEIGFDFPFGELGGDEIPKSRPELKMPWESDERVVFRRTKKEKVVTAAEMCLDGELLERLIGEARKMRRWITVRKAGVTENVVDQIRLIWKTDELAMLKFDIPLCRNMDRAREIVETKTRGLVVWVRKDALVVYRGENYRFGSRSYPGMHSDLDGRTGEKMMDWMGHEMAIDPITRSLYEREGDRLLDGLGPRYIDWWRPKPLPVDADLLPVVVPGFKTPFRLRPPSGKVKLTDDELTYLRKLAVPLPFHFVLGRNRKLQGLAAAILKLWEKTHIVKIAVKFGALNTDNEQMAYELKSLTGGVLLLRNKFLIILYRGKDFLPGRVANVVMDREAELDGCQVFEEAARLKAVDSFYTSDETSINSSISGTLSEFEGIISKRADDANRIQGSKIEMIVEKERLEKELRSHQRKLNILKGKIMRSVKELTRLKSGWRPLEHDTDQEMITEEERECLRKIGLKIDSSLVLGRRGVFDGVIEGLHQHWKHREVVKVITMQRLMSRVIYTAKQLETESGGMLVSVDKLKEGYAIIIYRGKNYRRPSNFVGRNLLNKKAALERSLELQRIGSLKFLAYQRQKEISELKCKLEDLEMKENNQIAPGKLPCIEH